MIIKLLRTSRVGLASYPTQQQYRSNCKIAGQVTELKNGLKAIVQIYSKSNNQLLGSTLTDSLGHYQFTGLQQASKYFLVSHHPTVRYNAVIQDNVVPK